jgi:protein gp37
MRQHQKNEKIREKYIGLTTKVNGIPTFNGTVWADWDRLEDPRKAKKPATWSIWTDFFHEGISFDFRLAAMKVMIEVPYHTFIILTKRIEKATIFFNHLLKADEIPANLILGVTVEDQERAEARLDELSACRVARRMISAEPMIGQFYLSKWLSPCSYYCDHDADGGGHRPEKSRFHAVVCGGETGAHARPIHPDCVRKLRDDCQAAGVAFFFKQWGSTMNIDQFTGYVYVKMAGYDSTKRNGGRLLDGREWNEVPT